MKNPLRDLLPAKFRKQVYALLALAMVALASWQAADGDWTLFALHLLVGLGFGQAHANTHPE